MELDEDWWQKGSMKYYEEIGLRDTFKRSKGASIKWKFRILKNDLVKAWQRAWYGYSNLDVVELNIEMEKKLLAILKEYRDGAPFIMTKPDSCECLSSEESKEIYEKLIRYIEFDLDEDSAYKHLYGCEYINDQNASRERLKKSLECRKAHQRYGFKLLQKYWDQLWW